MYRGIIIIYIDKKGIWLSPMDYKTNLVLHISFSFFFLFLVHCLYSIVFLISFMDFLINKLYLVSCILIDLLSTMMKLCKLGSWNILVNALKSVVT